MPSRATDAKRSGTPGLPAIHTLQSGRQRLHVLPSLGGALAGWEWQRDDRWLPLLRPWSADPAALYATSCFPLLPWSNRITGGGFDFDGKHYPLQPNRPGEPYPIHGDSWRQAWSISAQAEDRMTLELESEHCDGNPYVYRARQLLTLRENALEIELRVTNSGPHTLPFGLGLHPYFVRDAQTRLQFRARGVWLSGAVRIPTEFTRTLPAGWEARPGNQIRFATLVIPAAGKPLELTVVNLPNSGEDNVKYVLDNVNRWRGQLRLAPITGEQLSAESSTLDLNGSPATLVNLAGHAAPGGMGGPFSSGAPFSSGVPNGN